MCSKQHIRGTRNCYTPLQRYPVFFASKNKDHNLDSSTAILFSYYCIYLKLDFWENPKFIKSAVNHYHKPIQSMANLCTVGAHRILGLVGLLRIESLHFHKSPLCNSHSYEPSNVSIGKDSCIQCHIGPVDVWVVCHGMEV